MNWQRRCECLYWCCPRIDDCMDVIKVLFALLLFLILAFPLGLLFMIMDPFNWLQWACVTYHYAKEGGLASGLVKGTAVLLAKMGFWMFGCCFLPAVLSWLLIVLFPWRVPKTVIMIVNNQSAPWCSECSPNDSSTIYMPCMVPCYQFICAWYDLFVIFCAIPAFVVSVHRMRGLCLRLKGKGCSDCISTEWHKAIMSECHDCCYPWSYSSFEEAHSVL